MGAGQIGGQHRIPVGALHPHDQPVAGDARVVDQNIDLAEFFDDRLHPCFDLVFIGHIQLESCSFAASGTDFFYYLGQLVLITRGDGHLGALPRQR